jgi:hypothetical protein
MAKKTGVQSLKCGGKKMKKKMAEGGSKIPYEELGSMAGDFLDKTITDQIDPYKDQRENPNKYLKQRDSLSTTGNIAKNTAKGAGIGAAIGSLVPIPGIGTGAGALIGAGVGAVSSTVKNLFTSKKKKQARITDQENWGKAWTGDATDRLSTKSYKEGGKKEKVKVSVPITTNPSPGAEKYKFQPSAVVKDEVHNNYWRPETRRNVGLELLKKGHFGSVQDTVATLKAWDNMTPEETLSYIDPENGFDATNNPKNPQTANPGGIRYWIKDRVDMVNGKGIRNTNVFDLYDSAKKKSALSTGKPIPKSLASTGMADGGVKGGKVEGKGTAKSDSIDKKVEDGSFIVPAENSQKAMELGKTYLNWKGDESANRKYPGSEVALSNGEVLFTPEEVDVLKYHGLDLNRLAPKAELGNKMKKGGWKYDEQSDTYYYNEDAQGDDPGAVEWYKANMGDSATPSPTADTKHLSLTTDKLAKSNIKVADQSTPPPPEEKGPLAKIMDFAPEIAGAIQIGAAGVGLAKAGRMPDVNVSESLREITTQARQESQYGLEPGTKTAMQNQAEKARRDVTNAVVNRGGSSAEVMANLQGILSTTTDKKFDIELADSAEKIRKKSIYYDLKTKMGDQEFDIKKMSRQDWLQMQEVNAGLLSAGISNIVGARKLKMEMDTMKKIGSSSADFSKL